MTEKKILYLSRRDVEKAEVAMSAIISAVEEAFREKGMGRTEIPPKIGIHPRPDAFIHAMPAYIPKLGSAGLKWVSGFPENAKLGLPYISGLIVWNDAETGLPLCVMDATWVTAKRTGAATAVAAKHLARKESRLVGVLGCGVQGFSNVEALRCLFPLERVKAYDIIASAAVSYAKKVRDELGLAVEVVSNPEAAVRGSDIVVTAGPILKNPAPVIEDAWFGRGAFASPVDYDSYWKSEVLQSVDKFATDDVGQMMYTRTLGYFQGIPSNVLDLGDIVAGKVPGRERDDERTMSMNLGLALDDMAVVPLVYRAAVAKGLGRMLDL
jgi:ornithine cyclodeaminase/alanine dehydrogenase